MENEQQQNQIFIRSGAILYSLLTGRVPFDTGSQEQLKNDIEHSLIKPLPPLPANGNHADWIIKKCMNPVANRRYLNAQELMADLRKVIAGCTDHFQEMCLIILRRKGCKLQLKQQQQFLNGILKLLRSLALLFLF